MRLFFAAAVVAFSASAHASFELMLIYDDTEDMVRRYDPVNRVQLGSFGQGMLGINASVNRMALNPTRPGTVSLMDQSGFLRTFDYSTGELVATTNTGSSPLTSLTIGTLRFTNSGNIIRTSSASTAPQVFDPLSGALISTWATFAGYSTVDIAPLADGRFLTLERQFTGVEYRFSLFLRSSTGGYLSGQLGYVEGTTGVFQSTLTREGNRIFASGYASFPEIYESSVSGNTIALPVDVPGASSSSTSFSNIAFGHLGRGYFIARTTSNAASMYHVDANAGFFGVQYTLPFTGNMTSIAVVNAPEPGTLTFLALSAGWLAKRRKRRA